MPDPKFNYDLIAKALLKFNNDSTTEALLEWVESKLEATIIQSYK